MRHPLPICALILAVSTGAASSGRWQQTASPGSAVGPPAGATCAIEGVVVNAQTGEPIRKAQVTAVREGGANASNQGPQASVSDVSGHFSITGLEPGRYRLDVEADRFAGQTYGARRPGGRGKPLELGNGQTLRDLSVRLQPAGAITGTVRDEDGDAVVRAFVRAIPVGGARFRGWSQAETNDLGAYRLFGLIPGTYLVQVDAQQQSERADSMGRTYVATFYPGVTSTAAAAPIQVQPGAEIQQIDIDMKPVHAVAVRGRMVNQSTGGSTQGGWVGLVPRDADSDSGPGVKAGKYFPGVRYNGGVQDSQGNFELRAVPAGSYWLTANLQGNGRQYQGREPLEVGDSDVQGLIVTVSAGVSIAGRIRIDPPKPFNYSSLGINLIPEEAMGGGGGGAQPKANGDFFLQDVGAGSYRLSVGGFPEEYYLKSAKLGGVDVLDAGLNIDSASPGALEIELSSQGGSISGAVFRDHQPAAATVFLVPNPPRRNRQDLYSMKATKADGTFTLLGLPPGDFKLFAFEDAEPGMWWSDPSALQSYEAKGQAIHIDDGGSQSIQLELIPAEAQE